MYLIDITICKAIIRIYCILNIQEENKRMGYMYCMYCILDMENYGDKLQEPPQMLVTSI